MCVLVQVESVTALDSLEAIASVPGVDGVFFGPADLSASMGLIGKPMAPEVQEAIARGIATVNKAGKAAGCLTADPKVARHYLAQGALYVGIGTDTLLLVNAATRALAAVREKAAEATAPSSQSSSVY
jgi:4-hydroxy-2-oxoheptanedioate aldolase